MVDCFSFVSFVLTCFTFSVNETIFLTDWNGIDLTIKVNRFFCVCLIFFHSLHFIEFYWTLVTYSRFDNKLLASSYSYLRFEPNILGHLLQILAFKIQILFTRIVTILQKFDRVLNCSCSHYSFFPKIKLLMKWNRASFGLVIFVLHVVNSVTHWNPMINVRPVCMMTNEQWLLIFQRKKIMKIIRNLLYNKILM